MPHYVPRQRKHKILKREASARNGTSNTNQIQILPPSRLEKEQKRRKLKEELLAGQSKISSGKQKRLDKYIENKLRKDENLDLLKKLADARVDTSRLQSSRHLGKRKFVDFVENDPTATHFPEPARDTGSRELSDVDSEDSFEEDHAGAFGHLDGEENTSERGPAQSLGIGLKVPLVLGEDGLPVIQVRQKKKTAKLKAAVEEVPWEGFDSESSTASELDNEEFSKLGADDEISEDEHGSATTEENEAETSGTPAKSKITPRGSAFKSWATQQLNKSLGHTPSYDQTQSLLSVEPGISSITAGLVIAPAKPSFKTTQDDNVLSSTDPGATRKAFSVHVERPPAIQESRLTLPILAEEQKIMEAIHNNSVVLVWGATGSGKTTQLPQFLFEAGYGNPGSSTPGIIGVTQPRRVAAVSMANRVKDELGQHGDKVSYQVRFDSSVSERTAIKYMTDGILLRELSQDVMLTKYSVLVIDEAHERSINSDVLIGMLSRIVPLRWKLSKTDSTIKELKLVIMSATLRTSDFLQNPRLFKSDPSPPPVVQAEGRQFPVTVHFARRTQREYLEEVCDKVIRAHRKLPQGGILVFLTGQNEIKSVRDNLSRTLSSTRPTTNWIKAQVAASETPLETEDLEIGNFSIPRNTSYDEDEIDIITKPEDEDDTTAWEEDGDAFDLGETPSSSLRVHILPLYSQLPTKDQLKVFEAPPDGARLIILATNVAETSLTIPGIKYVFDCGRSKERVYDQATGVQRFEINWISKASAEQRAGRAGRTEAGHCYRLYSSAVYERDFAQHADPEILRTPIESVVLQLKTFHVGNVASFPFPTPPPRESLIRAEKLLRNLGALSADTRVTPMGAKLSLYPVSPRLSKILNVCIGSQPEYASHVVSIVAGISVGDIFTPDNQIGSPDSEDEENKTQRKDYNKARAFLSKTDPKSDVLRILTAISGYACTEDREQFCNSMFLRPKAMQEAMQLHSQLSGIVRVNNRGLVFPPTAAAPSSKQCALLNEVVASGYVDHIAIRADQAPNPPEMPGRAKRAIDVPYLPLIPFQDRDTSLEVKAIYLHPSSVLAGLNPKEMPTYLVYSHLQQAQPAAIESHNPVIPKTRMFPLSPIDGEQLAELAHGTPLLEYGKPVGHKINMLGGTPERRECWVVPSLVGEQGAIGWPLPARKVIQRKDLKVGWVIEKFLS